MADLQGPQLADSVANPIFGDNWVVANQWSEQARYQTTRHHKAKRLFDAITDKVNGVMPWIRVRW